MKGQKELDKAYGKELRRLRKHFNLKQPNLVEPLGLQSQQQVSDLENGKKHFSDETILNICRLFDISVLHFLNKPVQKNELSLMSGTEDYKEIEEAVDNETKLILYKRLYLKTKIEYIEMKLKTMQPKKGKQNFDPSKHKVHVII